MRGVSNALSQRGCCCVSDASMLADGFTVIPGALFESVEHKTSMGIVNNPLTRTLWGARLFRDLGSSHLGSYPPLLTTSLKRFLLAREANFCSLSRMGASDDVVQTHGRERPPTVYDSASPILAAIVTSGSGPTSAILETTWNGKDSPQRDIAPRPSFSSSFVDPLMRMRSMSKLVLRCHQRIIFLSTVFPAVLACPYRRSRHECAPALTWNGRCRWTASAPPNGKKPPLRSE